MPNEVQIIYNMAENTNKKKWFKRTNPKKYILQKYTLIEKSKVEEPECKASEEKAGEPIQTELLQQSYN